MNTFVGSGRLTRNAVINGTDTKAMKFTIAARYGYDQEKKEDRVEFVPCVLFNPSEKLQSLLTEEGKGMRIELQGRVATSKFEADGETRFSTEVVVDKRSLKIVSTKDTLPY